MYSLSRLDLTSLYSTDSLDIQEKRRRSSIGGGGLEEVSLNSRHESHARLAGLGLDSLLLLNNRKKNQDPSKVHQPWTPAKRDSTRSVYL